MAYRYTMQEAEEMLAEFRQRYPSYTYRIAKIPGGGVFVLEEQRVCGGCRQTYWSADIGTLTSQELVFGAPLCAECSATLGSAARAKHEAETRERLAEFALSNAYAEDWEE